MFSAFFKARGNVAASVTLNQIVRTREFWIYVGVYLRFPADCRCRHSAGNRF